MDALVVLVFLLMPTIGGMAIAVPVFLVAFFANQFLLKYKTATIIIHLMAITFLSVHFTNAVNGELGRNMAFMIAHIIGIAIVLYIYILLLRSMRKLKVSNRNKNMKNTTNQQDSEPISDINDKLIMAVINNDMEQVELLVTQGANPQSKNNSGYSAEDYARGRNLRIISDYFESIT